jgi:CshA-type fibril repeat protein
MHQLLLRRAGLLLVAAIFPLASSMTGTAMAASTCGAQQLTVTPLQSNVFYIDAAVSYVGSYVGYRVTDTGSGARSGLWVRLESFTGGVVRPPAAATMTKAVPLASLVAGASTPTYAYLVAAAASSTVQKHDVVVYDSAPASGGSELCRETQTIASVSDVIKAAANKVTSGSVSPSTVSLGGTFQLSVTGSTGTVGAGPAGDPGIVRFSPAVASDWPSSSFRLVSVSDAIPLGGAATADVLSRSGMSAGDQPYSVTYTFRVVGSTSVATPVVPVQNIASGTQVKHTDPGSLASVQSIPIVTSSAVLAVGATTAGPYVTGVQVPLGATLTNSGSSAVMVDELDLTLPVGWTYVPGSATVGGTAHADPYAASATGLHLVGPFTVAAHGSLVFAVGATAGTAGSQGVLSGIAPLAGGQIDATTDPSDSTPATANLAVLGAPSAIDDTVIAAQGLETTVDVLANDNIAGGTASVAIASGPTHGTAAVSGDHVLYTATGGYTGPDSLSYTLTTEGGSSTATVSLTVTSPPPAPSPAALASTGVGTATQSQTISVPTSGTVTLLDSLGAPTTTLTESLVGSYLLDAASGVVTFTPLLSWQGTAAGVSYRVTDAYGQTGDATYTPSVTPPAGPAPPAVSSAGIGTAAQTGTLPIPAQGSVVLLDGVGSPATAVSVAGVGDYSLDTLTGIVTFTPVLGYAGTTAAVPYRVVDAYGQVGDATYTATVVAPVPPAPVALASTGVGTAPQARTLTIPTSGSLALLDTFGTPVTTLAVANVGSYVLVPSTGVVTFSAALGFQGTAAGVAYRATDAYGQAGDSTYTPTVTPPAAPAPTPLATSGPPASTQQVTLLTPTAGTASLLDGATPTTTIVVAHEGTYTLVTATGIVTFTPAAGFSGTGTGVVFRLTDAYGSSGTARWTPTVSAPGAPAAPARSTTGVGLAIQTTTLPIPDGGSVTLLDASGTAVSVVAVAGEGTYTLDVATGTVSFVPGIGWSGIATGVSYRVVDAYGQPATGTYTANVTTPDAPAAPPLRTVGAVDTGQIQLIVIPVGGTITLLDADGRPATTVTVPGEGTYVLDATAGRITFLPLPGWTGVASAVTYRLTDAYGQTGTSTYAASVTTRKAPHLPVRPTARAGARVPRLLPTIGPDQSAIPVLCTIASSTARGCDVTVTVHVSGRDVRVGHATVRRRSHGGHLLVTVHLNPLGVALSDRVGGARMTITARVVRVSGGPVLSAHTTARVVRGTVFLPRPVFFDSASSVVRTADRRYLRTLRTRLTGVRAVECEGSTDSLDTTTSILALGRQRAARVCEILTRGLDIASVRTTNGESRPPATNHTPTGRQLNRRTDIRLHY